MQTEHNDQGFIFDRSIWTFITQCSLCEDDCDGDIAVELSAGSLFQSMREIGLPAERLNKIGETIIETAREAARRFHRDTSIWSVKVLLFCQRSMMDGAGLTENQMKRGWGYFLIQRSRELPDALEHDAPDVIELYLYKE